ncbi:MAG: 4-(cytidine 5'-diphospho)-2-C-methyl-D-erythritol kinase [Candidatus Omnitrophota bacterium]
MSRLTLNSPAKVNLFLKVLNKRSDNYHNIKTIFERISLFDTISLEATPGKRIKINCKDPQVPKNSSNLCFRAAAILQERFGVKSGVEIAIIKRIPVGAGLGGGSSNAACVLAGLNKLWKLRIPVNKLAKIAASIGADVPFFVYNSSFALGEARGDRITPFKNPRNLRLWHILVVPRIKVLTPFIYKEWDKRLKNKKLRLTMPGSNVKIFRLALNRKDPSLIKEALFNSLEAVTVKLHPEVGLIKKELALLGLKTILMSGSGPAVFGVVSSGKEAATVKRILAKKRKSWRIFTAKTV